MNKLLASMIKKHPRTIDQIAYDTGITRMQLYRYRSMEQEPGVKIANTLARYFGTTTEKLFPFYNNGGK